MSILNFPIVLQPNLYVNPFLTRIWKDDSASERPLKNQGFSLGWMFKVEKNNLFNFNCLESIFIWEFLSKFLRIHLKGPNL